MEITGDIDMSLHHKVLEAFDEIDAAVFSGDSFHDEEAADELDRMMARWASELRRIRTRLAQDEEE